MCTRSDPSLLKSREQRDTTQCGRVASRGGDLLSANHVRDNEVRRRLFLQAPHVPKGRNEGPRKDSPEEMRRSRQESVLTPYSRRMGYNDVV